LRLFIPVEPVSINKCFQGRRFKTKASKEYDAKVANAVMRTRGLTEPIKAEWYSVNYSFYVSNYSMTDVDNLIKQTQDCIVRAGLISDDRRIKKITVEKFRATGELPMGTMVEILPYC
jgi:Holliday junction resolvase RusA-like endonuclease